METVVAILVPQFSRVPTSSCQTLKQAFARRKERSTTQHLLYNHDKYVISFIFLEIFNNNGENIILPTISMVLQKAKVTPVYRMACPFIIHSNNIYSAA